jgi:hypothetical protein
LFTPPEKRPVKERINWWRDEKWTRRFLFLKNMGWKPAQDVTARDIFKIQNVNLVQSAGVLGSPKGDRTEYEDFQWEQIMAIGYFKNGDSSVECLEGFVSRIIVRNRIIFQ